MIEQDNNSEDEIAFSGKSENYCVGFVTMVDSVGTAFEVNTITKIRRYYSLFINTLAPIAQSFGAKIIKSTDTSLIYYFPNTSLLSSSIKKLSAFRDVILCGIAMMTASTDINTKLREEGLPFLNYKISADYGRVEMARSSTSPETEDLFGPTMNACAKINSMAPPNGMVIGSDLYYMAKKLSLVENDSYGFKRIGEYSVAASFKLRYPVYVFVHKKNKLQTLSVHKHSAESKSISNKSNELPTYNYNILVVDDEPDILLTFKTFLLSADPNYSVDIFTDSQKALERFSQVDRCHYSLAIMDVRMPDLNGLELYCRLKSINPEVKVIFVSALGIAEEISSILPEIKRDDVIQKPVDKEDFVYKVKAALYSNSNGE
ncbi:MAG TPA: response regulator [Nitrososphaeraceae archaeon]|nr:response regulator [Nitrososphaeraceae archaeon]